jgi:hypothetical protein
LIEGLRQGIQLINLRLTLTSGLASDSPVEPQNPQAATAPKPSFFGAETAQRATFAVELALCIALAFCIACFAILSDFA